MKHHSKSNLPWCIIVYHGWLRFAQSRIHMEALYSSLFGLLNLTWSQWDSMPVKMNMWILLYARLFIGVSRFTLIFYFYDRLICLTLFLSIGPTRFCLEFPHHELIRYKHKLTLMRQDICGWKYEYDKFITI